MPASPAAVTIASARSMSAGVNTRSGATRTTRPALPAASIASRPIPRDTRSFTVGGCAGSDEIAATTCWTSGSCSWSAGRCVGSATDALVRVTHSIGGEPVEDRLHAVRSSGRRASGGPVTGLIESAIARRADASGSPSSNGCARRKASTCATRRGAGRLQQPVAKQPFAGAWDAGARAGERERVRGPDRAPLVGEDRREVVARRRGAPGQANFGGWPGAPRRRGIQHRAAADGFLPAGFAQDEPVEDVEHHRARRRDPHEGLLSGLDPGAPEDPESGIRLRRAGVDLVRASTGDRMREAPDRAQRPFEDGRGPPGAGTSQHVAPHEIGA